MKQKIYYTLTDEAPALATRSLLPIFQYFSSWAGIEVKTKDISLSARILANFFDFLPEEQQVPDDLLFLGKETENPETNIIKLPNISASVPQLKVAIEELRQKGYDIPPYIESPSSEKEKKIKAIYRKVLGSAVNPVLRQGNSDRRAPKPVKQYVKNNPHKMGKWDSKSKTHVSSMSKGDFLENEKSMIFDEKNTLSIIFENLKGEKKILKEKIEIQAKEVVDTTKMSVKELKSFIRKEIKDTKKNNVLFSVHLKATMMKVSDPIIFGVVVKEFFNPLIKKYSKELKSVKVNFNNGVGNLLKKVKKLDHKTKKKFMKDLEKLYAKRPDLSMVNSDKGITNLNVSSDVIIDASMPAMIRQGGKMWDADGKTKDTKAVIPDRSYAGVYQEVINDCKKNGAFDPVMMGSVPNVGLMAQKAEEYGSHEKTFQAPDDGEIYLLDVNNNKFLSQKVEKKDIFRMCQVKDEPIRDWIKLAISRANISNTPIVFWLDEDRAHDRKLIQKVKLYLKDFDITNIEMHILSPREATKFSIERIRKGLDTISVTGNVLRDYLTDLFPILEVGTSAKMLSIVPLIKGGGLFETGAGGSAPKHVQQFLEKGHLRWDSLGEFLAFGASLEHLSQYFQNKKAKVLAKTLDLAINKFLIENKSPSRKAGKLDTRGSHFYLAYYWTESLKNQEEDEELKQEALKVYQKIYEKIPQIEQDMMSCQGQEQNIGGYYFFNEELVGKAMRPSASFNEIIK